MPKMKSNWIVLCGLLIMLGVAEWGFSQAMAPVLPRQGARPLTAISAQTQTPMAAPQNPYLGAVPSGEATPQELSVSLAEAIERGLRNNLGQYLSKQETRAALGERWQARSGLLPQVSTRITETLQQVNLAAFGFGGFPDFPDIAGPFGIFDSRIFLSQSVFDPSAINNARAASENLKAANYSYENARDIVVTVAANLYLQAVAGASRTAAAQAQINTAQALYDQAVNFKQAGVVPAIEVLRAQVELQARQQQLIFYRNEFEKQKLNLARAIGLPMGQQFRLSDQLPYAPLPPLTQQQALDQAYHSRSDYQSAMAAVRASEHAKKAAQEERFPSISINADFGDIGRRITSSHETFAASASLHVPIFQGGRTRGEILQADALLEQRKAQLEDLRSRIEYEVRTVFLDLKASGDRVAMARSAIELARQQMEQARDRFAAGVTGNIEVVQAQEALATANENYIASTYAYNVAKTSLARALGGAEKSFKQFLLGETQ